MGLKKYMALAAVALLELGAMAWAQLAAELLEKGIYAEETVGDLEAAIGIYNQIVNDARAARPNVA